MFYNWGLFWGGKRKEFSDCAKCAKNRPQAATCWLFPFWM